MITRVRKSKDYFDRYFMGRRKVLKDGTFKSLKLTQRGKLLFKMQHGDMKICRICGEAFPRTTEYFHSNKDTLDARCKCCTSKRLGRKRWTKEEPENFGPHYFCPKCGLVMNGATTNINSGGAVRPCNKCSNEYVMSKYNLPLKYSTTTANNLMALGIEFKVDTKRLVQVKCTYCDKWTTPTRGQYGSKMSASNAVGHGECNIYCSDGCKEACPTFNQSSSEKGLKAVSSRETQPVTRKLIFARDNHTCTKCGTTEGVMHAHHIEGVAHAPGLQHDLDNLITVCKACHIKIHTTPGCRFVDYTCHK